MQVNKNESDSLDQVHKIFEEANGETRYYITEVKIGKGRTYYLAFT